MIKDPFIRVKFTKEQSFARQIAKEYFEKYPKDRYQTEVESWRELQSRNIEIIMKRLREPLMHARIGVLRALNRNVERALSDRKEMPWGKRKLKRDHK